MHVLGDPARDRVSFFDQPHGMLGVHGMLSVSWQASILSSSFGSFNAGMEATLSSKLSL